MSAFTATATDRVRQDIVSALELQDAKVLVTGFDRPNLYFEVRRPKSKPAALLQTIREQGDSSGIVYCATRKAVEQVCALLQGHGIAAGRYHDGLEQAERQQNQEDFLFDRIKIMSKILTRWLYYSPQGSGVSTKKCFCLCNLHS